MVDFDTVVIGAGAVGLACAARLSTLGHSVLIMERNSGTGQETSSRNSGVIHAGIYYPRGSLKATLCVRGRELLYDRCRRHGLAHQRCGKLIVATNDEETSALEGIFQRGQNNGVASLELVDRDFVSRLEPHVTAVAGIWSPDTGIVDPHEIVYCYSREAVESGATLSLNTSVEGLELQVGRWRVATRSGGEDFDVTASWVVNAAGLHADAIAELAGVDTARQKLRLHYCKGDYFSLAPRFWSMIRHLVYPVPTHAGLGVHLTFDTGGKVTAGPDTEYVDDLSYAIDENKRQAFAEALARYFPHVGPGDLSPDYAGIRPKLQGPKDTFRDFAIDECSGLGMPRLINLLGIESPGLTASEAIAERVTELMRAA